MGVNLGTPRWVRGWGWATLVANSILVVTGGAVRLTASGLGCPTWPRCTEESFTPHGALTMHAAIEFGNRTLTFVLAAVAVLTFISAWQSGRRDLRGLALIMGLGIPAQAVIGGITVLTDLNPWVVSFHLLVSLAIISLSVLYLRRIDRPLPPPVIGRPRLWVLGWLMYVAAWATLYVGTVVTGSGPHAGDVNVPRNGLNPLHLSQLHADLVFLLLGLTIALVVVHPSTPVIALLVVELAQGTIGFVQYFTGLPVVVVALHLLGAAVLTAVATWALLDVRATARVDTPRDAALVGSR